ncbi:hypothetical protein BX600DRAFT_443522 [Xylariales sp. PMI_506]|nr:hypothetical protein BX600DRAFT_443522 [Xylariales sp. PMI_506]
MKASHVLLATPVLAGGVVDWASLRCPHNPNATLPTPTYGDNGTVFTICAELLIAAPIAEVYYAIVDFDHYADWNSFVYDLVLPAGVAGHTPQADYVGLSMFFYTTGLIEGVNTTSTEVITVLSPPEQLGGGGGDRGNGFALAAWRSDDGAGGTLLRAEHPSILVAEKSSDGSEVTRYVSYETYYDGPEVLQVEELRDNLQTEFVQEGLDLKAYVEGKQRRARA